MHGPDCRAPHPPLEQLLFLHKEGEPSGHPGHNITYDHHVIEICPSCNGATVVRLNHDCWDFEEVWDQYEWYELTPSDGARLRELAARCDKPLDPSCGCALHKSLRESVRTLPLSGWGSVVEESAHRHAVALTDGATPAFRLVSSGVPSAPTQTSAPPKQGSSAFSERSTYTAMGLAVVLYGGALTLYFRGADLHWLLDVAIALALIPVTVLGAVALVALMEVVRES